MRSFGALPVLPRRRVVVCGLGAVTPLGTTVAKTWHNVVRGHSSGKPLSQVPYFLPDGSSSHSLDAVLKALPCNVACPVIDDEPVPTTVSGKPGVGRFAPTPREARSHRFCQVATLEALSDAKLLSTPPSSDGADKPTKQSPAAFDDTICPKERVAVNIGMGIPSLMDISDTAKHLLHGAPGQVQYNKVHPFFVPKILGNMAAGNIAIAHGFKGPIGSSVAACATGAHCVGEAARWIEEGSADIALAGGAESCINPISIAGFARMRALSTCSDAEKASRPFDAARSGFVMGEGAAILVLEELEHAKARGATIYAELRGFGCTGDAYHVSSPDPSGYGAKTCVQQALKHGGVHASQVGYVNAHATSTPVGDEIELAALAAIFGDSRTSGEATSPVIVSSSKGGLGHLLGAAGAIEAIITVLSLHHKVAPPNVNLTQPIPYDANILQLNTGTVPSTSGVAAVSTSFGFGGVNTALVFTEYSEDK